MKKRAWTAEEDFSLRLGYRSGEDIAALARRFKVSRSALYRRLNMLCEPAREPRKRRHTTNKCKIFIYPQGHRLVRDLLGFAQTEWYTITKIADVAGLTRETVCGWNRGGNPTLASLERLGVVLGKKLRWVNAE